MYYPNHIFQKFKLKCRAGHGNKLNSMHHCGNMQIKTEKPACTVMRAGLPHKHYITQTSKDNMKVSRAPAYL